MNSTPEFQRDKGQPSTKEEWEALSPEDREYWEAKRRRRRHQRRRGKRPKTLSEHMGQRSPDGVRGKSKPMPPKLSKVPQKTVQLSECTDLSYAGNAAEHTHFPPNRLPAEPPKYAPPALSSGSSTDDGLSAQTELRMVTDAMDQRWPVTAGHRAAAVESLLTVISHCSGDEDTGQNPRPDTAVKAISALTRMMGQNQQDEHEMLKRTTLTKDQMDFLLEAISASIKSRLEDHPELRQQIKSDLMNAMITQGLLNRD